MSLCTRMLAAFVAAVTLIGSTVQAGQVKLDVSMAQPTLIAGKKQTAYLKVGLTGFKFQSDKERPSVNVALVLDKSGSMKGEKINRAREAAISAIERLNKNDIVSVITYDATVNVLVPATKLTDKKQIIEKIKSIGAGGSTALFAGVSKGAGELRKFLDSERVNRIILLSDGLANVGPKSPSELGDLGRSLGKEGIAVSTMGLGLHYNEDLMVQLAQNSDGNHIFIKDAADLVKIFNYEFDDVLSVVAQEVAITITCENGVRPVRMLNGDAEINGQTVVVGINQIYSEQEKYVLLEVEIPAAKPEETLKVAAVNVSYANMQTNTTDRLSSEVSVNFSENIADVKKSLNRDVMEQAVLQVANRANGFATQLRDQGDIEGARQVLLGNSAYLGENGELLGSELLMFRCVTNKEQSKKLDEKDWKFNRKQMRRLQYKDQTQQKY
ncbi:von Willebrand factor type A domain protein [Symmachiella dynata]|uniref:von Willebrand factor type A domain protein n=1 Tax=Symmachiella dynata TaxID=2527995 RepID=A0A517ZSY3_9PLAN|nr:VWA domain-containing protein [Symmachiella dynata]QDU45535.1 von Willebrand factor type A domain protein [Symmachiella dynata]